MSPAVGSITLWIQMGAASIFVVLAFFQVMSKRGLSGFFLRYVLWGMFGVLIAGVAFGKYYASSIPRYLDQVAESNPASAIVGYTEALKVSPGTADLYYGRGRADLLGGRYPEAVADFAKALAISPGNPKYLSYRAWGFFYQGDYQAAENDINAARQGGYNDSGLNLVESFVAAGRGQFDLAINGLTAALKSGLDFETRCSALADRGVAYTELNQNDLALSDLNEVYRSCPSIPRDEVLGSIGDVYVQKGDFERALELWGQALKINPQRAAVLFSRASLYMRLDRHQEALDDLGRYLQVQPEDPLGYTTRAKIYGGLHDYPRAAADINRANELLERKGPSIYQVHGLFRMYSKKVPRGTPKTGQ